MHGCIAEKKTSVGDITLGLLDLHLPHENEVIRFFKTIIQTKP